MNFKENILLENRKVRIEPLDNSHFNKLLPISLNHPDLLRYSPSLFGTTDALKENIQIAVKARKNEQRYAFVIFDKKGKNYIGSTSYGNISMKNQRLEIGWTWIDKNSQGTGINKNCKYLLLEYAFKKLHILRVEFRTDKRNAQSRRAIEKIGAKFEGELRSHTLMSDGHRRDTVCYSILKNEWDLIKEERFKEIHHD